MAHTAVVAADDASSSTAACVSVVVIIILIPRRQTTASHSSPLFESERDRECERECRRPTGERLTERRADDLLPPRLFGAACGDRGTGERERDDRRDGERRSLLRPLLRCAGAGERDRERPPPPPLRADPLRAGGESPRERERRAPRGEREREWLRERERRSPLRLRLRLRDLCVCVCAGCEGNGGKVLVDGIHENEIRLFGCLGIRRRRRVRLRPLSSTIIDRDVLCLSVTHI